MPLIAPHQIAGKTQTNLTAAAPTGTTVTASATAHTKGSWTEIIASTDKDSWGFWLKLSDVAAGATDTSLLVDIGYGPAASEQVLVADINAGQATASSSAGKLYYFPVFVPAGVRVVARCQAAVASDTVLVSIFLCQDVLYPIVAGPAETYGAVSASSRGTLVTAGNAAFGSWTQISTGTARAHRFWVLGADGGSDTTMAIRTKLIELGIGPDSGNVTAIASFTVGMDNSETVTTAFPLIAASPVPSGTALWIRVAQDGAAEARGYIVYGVD